MKMIIKTSRIFYAIALFVYGVQQFIYADFRPVFFPAWQSALPISWLWAYVFGLFLILTSVAIVIEKKAKTLVLILGSVLLLLFCFVQIPFEIISDPYSKHLALWTNALKELALAGGAFVIAGTFKNNSNENSSEVSFIKTPEKLIPFGKLFFSITMISFGIEHFMYADGVSALVPKWFPDPVFWTFFAAVGLIGSGVSIILDIKTEKIAMLLGIMIFLWVFLLHLPRAIDKPYIERGNELSSMFDALAFSGIAFIIAITSDTKNVKKI